ncbi:hypothetical protein EHQ55_07065 [Leptospira meyeri]|uniref:hypothetical protein n=1 Tax=Leptospira meyeri TaxID=29508 RepID=UPI00108391B6|nr:hypothetical protein [Leptospira meyeri]TGL50789.1 hypothetical protein EHQ55_07065 [Leptospira meyeri]
MPSIRISKATREEDEELVQFTASFASEGSLKLALDRSPSFFDSLAKDGENPEIIIGRDLSSNQLVGVGYRIESDYLFQRKRLRFGYLAGLRLLKGYRSGIALARGYQKLKELHEKSSCNGYFTTIQSENQNAIRILSSHRAGLPFYQFITRLTTFIWNPRAFNKKTKLRTVQINNINEYKSFLKKTERPAYLSPYLDDSFYENKQITRYFIKDGEKTISCFSIWNQNQTKRWRVIGYSRWIHFFRKFYNLYAQVRNLPILPNPGSTLNYLFLTQLCIAKEYENRLPEIFSQILLTSLNDFPFAYLCYSLSKEDPWYPFIKKIPSWKIESFAYFVYWNPSENLFAQKIDGFSIWEAGLL